MAVAPLDAGHAYQRPVEPLEQLAEDSAVAAHELRATHCERATSPPALPLLAVAAAAVAPPSSAAAAAACPSTSRGHAAARMCVPSSCSTRSPTCSPRLALCAGRWTTRRGQGGSAVAR